MAAQSDSATDSPSYAYQAKLASRCTGLVSRKINCHRAEIAARAVQSVAAIGARALLCAGAQWWVCRSASAAMWALYKSGVPSRTIVHEDGTIECWQQPKLPAWERRSPTRTSGGHERRTGIRKS